MLVLPRSGPKASLPKTKSFALHIVKGISCKKENHSSGKKHGGGYLEAFDTGASPVHPPREKWLVLMFFCI